MSDSTSLEPTHPQRRILIVDDSPIFREIETVFLGRSGIVLTANDGTTALELARRERPDLVVSDLHMRTMDGDQLCREMRGDPDLRRTPVIVVTSGTSADDHERAVRAGADDVVEKPLRRLSFLQAVNRFLKDRLRSQPRAELVTDVQISVDGQRCSGRSLNVSRGGIYVESEQDFVPDTELSLEFSSPDGAYRFRPTARVAWRMPPKPDAAAGMGLQFLKLEHSTAEWLDDYVYEFATPESLADVAPPA